MPTYEYACRSCGNELEAQQRIVEPALKTCPACGKDELERLISRTSFHLKGGGWYKDLYSSTSGADRTENDRADRLGKAISDDKAKSASPSTTESASPAAAPASSDSAGASSSPSPSSGGSSSSGSSGGGGSSAAA